jgi:hypothetical protein
MRNKKPLPHPIYTCRGDHPTEGQIDFLIEHERAHADAQGHWEFDDRNEAAMRSLARQVLTLGMELSRSAS